MFPFKDIALNAADEQGEEAVPISDASSNGVVMPPAQSSHQARSLESANRPDPLSNGYPGGHFVGKIPDWSPIRSSRQPVGQLAAPQSSSNHGLSAFSVVDNTDRYGGAPDGRRTTVRLV